MFFYRETLLSLFFILVSIVGLSACGNDGNDAFKEAVMLNSLNITAINVISDNDIVETGEEERYRAVAEIDSGSAELDITDKVHWKSSNNSIVSINQSGVATSLMDGVVEIRAELADLFGVKDLNSSDALLESIEISTQMPAVVGVCSYGYTLTALGNYEGETSPRTITSLVDWTSDNPEIAEISSTGVVTALHGGDVIFKAMRADKEDSLNRVVARDLLTGIVVTPDNTSLFTGGTQQFKALGNYSNLITPMDITETVDWATRNSDGAITGNHMEMARDGTGRAISAGDAVVVASCAGDPLQTPVLDPAAISNEVTVTINVPVILTGIEINGGSDTEPVDLADKTVQLSAKLVLSDGSRNQDVTSDTDTTWSVKSGSATVSNAPGSKGEVSFSQTGSSEIKVVYTDSNNVTVSDTIDVDVN